MQKKGILVLFLFIFSLTFVQAQEFGDVQQCSTSTGAGLTLSVSHPIVGKVGENITFSIIAYDSNGKRKTSSDTTCTIGLGGSQGEPVGFINETDITVIPSPIWAGVLGMARITLWWSSTPTIFEIGAPATMESTKA